VGKPKKHKWKVRNYRTSTMPFKDGERAIYRYNTDEITFRTLRMARENSCRHRGTSTDVRLAGGISERKRRVVELQLWPDNSDE